MEDELTWTEVAMDGDGGRKLTVQKKNDFLENGESTNSCRVRPLPGLAQETCAI